MSTNQTTPRKQDIAQLNQALAEAMTELKALPEAIAQETSKALAPLQTMQEALPQIAEAFDQVESTQRDSLQQLSEEMVAMSSQGLQNTLAPLQEELQQLGRARKELTAMQAQLTATMPQLMAHSQQLSQHRAERRKPWRRALVTAAISLLSALIVVIGQAAFAPTKVDPDTQANAQWAQQVWSKATEQERELLRQIATRPAP